ncbi:hypothetical protein QYE76_052991 [Lolium multiflorum]|uniref:Ribonuclease H1 N-terminal domain-containing protein n=1 Tax=Lolium multiflorum TaxID=4521 RepID=A0AAD8SW45_LOLMU|nr:hypothetical protein QYE76_052991 [Lolium multiflorum]
MPTYVVYKGRVPGVYEEWQDCLEQVHKFSGNSYKGYATREEAVAQDWCYQLTLEIPLVVIAAIRTLIFSNHVLGRYEEEHSIARGGEEQLDKKLDVKVDMELDMKTSHGRAREEREACARGGDLQAGARAGQTGRDAVPPVRPVAGLRLDQPARTRSHACASRSVSRRGIGRGLGRGIGMVELEPAVFLHSRKTMVWEFSDVFPEEVPAGLPPLRGIEHQIDLIPGASLPNRASYRTNPEETKEIQKQAEQIARRSTPSRRRLRPPAPAARGRPCPHRHHHSLRDLVPLLVRPFSAAGDARNAAGHHRPSRRCRAIAGRPRSEQPPLIPFLSFFLFIWFVRSRSYGLD